MADIPLTPVAESAASTLPAGMAENAFARQEYVGLLPMDTLN